MKHAAVIDEPRLRQRRRPTDSPAGRARRPAEPGSRLEGERPREPGDTDGDITRSDSGVALIIVLGVLALLAILVVSFSRVTRSERLAGRSATDRVRADSLTHVALTRAMEQIDDDMVTYTYPYWTNVPGAYDATCSSGSSACSNLLSGHAWRFVPGALSNDVAAARDACRWTDIVVGSQTVGRVAYVIANCSGLLDANVVGGVTRTDSTSVRELDLSGLPLDIGDASRFFSDRLLHRRYETVAELGAMNRGTYDPPDSLFVYSYDPDRDQYFTNSASLGLVSVTNGLKDKLDINDTSAANYDTRLEELIRDAGLPGAPDIVSCIRDYLDTDRTPRNGSATPWLLSSCETGPLINEIALQQLAGTTSYQFKVELWYPFFSLSPTQATFECVMKIRTTNASINATQTLVEPHTITSMKFGGTNEFITFESPTFTLSSGGSNVAVSTDYPVWFLASVSNTAGAQTDQAPSLDYVAFTNEIAISINDPRQNHDWSKWIATDESLGGMNSNCNPWAAGCQGLPIFHRDGPMVNIGEIGHIYIPGTSAWHNINLLSENSGAALLDWLTVRATNAPTRGLISLSTQQDDVLRTLFHGVRIGYVNSAYTTNRTLTTPDIDTLVDAVFDSGQGGVNFREMFADIGATTAFETWQPDGHPHGDIKEDAFRNIVEMLTFRNNTFTIFLAAQVLAADGETVTAEQRAVAVVWRDAYTGESRVRLLMRLSQ